MRQEKTLVVYATKGGTTEEYANAITSVLGENKWQVDVINLKKNHNPDLMLYRNVIVGSGIKMHRMHGDGRKFLEKDFGDRKVAIFLSSLETRDEAIEKYIEKILEKNKKLKPIDIEVFGGRMRFLGKTREDKMDVDKAKEWAQKIISAFQTK
jgi:menaquinone-dependent protoporphyrinogen IX oxidase